MIRILKFALLGAVGFGAGELLCVKSLSFLEGIHLDPYSVWQTVSTIGAVAAAMLFGSLGGLALGLGLGKSKRPLAISSGAGFLVGLIASGATMRGPVISGITGVVIGAALGLAFRNLKTMLILAVAGGLGFWLGDIVTGFVLDRTVLYSMEVAEGNRPGIIPFDLALSFILVTVHGLLGGAVLGATLAYLKKE